MNKENLLKFIELYNLSGTIEKVKLVSDGKTLGADIVTEDRTLIGNVKFEGIKIPKGEYGIHDTVQFKKLLSILDDEVDVEVTKYDGEPVGLLFSDKNTESLVMLADLAVIPKVPPLANGIQFDLELVIDDAFIERFIKAKNALPETNVFVLMMNKKGDKIELIIGYSSNNSNRVKLDITAVAGKDKLPKELYFNADYFKEILSKNRGVPNTVFQINSNGLGHLQFKTDQYEANYYILKKTEPST
jgi:hypothetical protein